MTRPNAPPSRQAQQRPRTDFRTRNLVNQAIASLPGAGLRRAANFLHTMHVPVEIAVRTLVYPKRRRR